MSTKEMKEFFNYVNEKYGSMGASSIIVKDNEIVEELSYGYSSREKETLYNVDTVCRIASVSKLIVATATMTLVEKGIIDLDEDISTYLGFKVRNPLYPDIPINMKMIFTQTSSITDGKEDGVNSDLDSGYNAIVSNGEIVKLEDLLLPSGSHFVKETFSKYKPGEHYEYANFGSGIQACIIERLTGIKFTKYVRDKVLLPLGLDASFDIRDIKNSDIATCYYNSKGVLKISRTPEQFRDNYIIKDRGLGHNYIGPAGGLFISCKDLTKIMMMFMNGGSLNGVKIIEKETMDRMLELTWIGNGDGDYTAKGCQFKVMDYFSSSEYGPVRLYGHFGGAYGVKSFLLFNKTEKVGFVYVINGGLFNYNPKGPSNVHEEVLRKYLTKYWNNDVTHRFEMVIGEDKGVLDGRIINLKYADINRKMSKRPKFMPITTIDVLSIPTWENDKKIIDELKDKLLTMSVFDYINIENSLYDYQIFTKDEKIDGNEKTTLIIEYRAKRYGGLFPRQDEIIGEKKLIENYHTHCAFCNHATGLPIDYLEEASKVGIKVMGISDHGPYQLSFIGVTDKEKLALNDGYELRRMNYNVFRNDYINSIKEASEKYPNIKVLTSVEIEYFPGHDEYYKDLLKYCDYLVLGEHIFLDPENDNKLTSAYFNMNYKNVISYAKEIEKALDTKLFKIVAHPDLFMFTYMSENGIKREFDNNAMVASRIIIEAATRNNCLLEYNCGGISRGKYIIDEKHTDYCYPRKEFFDLVKEYKDAKVCIGLDAHNPKFVSGNYLTNALREALKEGLNPINVK